MVQLAGEYKMNIKKIISIALLAITIILLVFYFSFKLGYEEGERKANTFTRLMVSTTALIQILENIDNQDKVENIAKSFLIDKLYDMMSAHELNYYPIESSQEYKARKMAKRVVQLMQENHLALFDLTQPDMNAERIVKYVKNNLEPFAQGG